MATRDVILDAAAEVMRSKGMANATTKEIARAAGYSEATLYKHFTDKTELLVAVLRERSPGFMPLVRALRDRAGEGTVQANLTEVARAAILFYSRNYPMLASIFSDPAILGAHKEGLGRHGAGPHLVNETLVAYLEAERALGRIRDDVDLPAAAGLLLGACFQHAFLDHMSPAGTHRASADPAATYASTLLPALLP